ncbi:hypothetical protein QCA50_007015 [Cerrena zonata]|uniref:Uncharacterized protein n=1 Tax=Cerrena zonata TaxID=2478898 RepID=A0AAW0GAA3_9APHY
MNSTFSQASSKFSHSSRVIQLSNLSPSFHYYKFNAVPGSVARRNQAILWRSFLGKLNTSLNDASIRCCTDVLMQDLLFSLQISSGSDLSRARDFQLFFYFRDGANDRISVGALITLYIELSSRD